MTAPLLAVLLLAAAPETDFAGKIRAAIQRFLGKPYVWGSSGLKSFDCSGFVWRVHYESGVLMKRSTARKYYFALPQAAAAGQSKFGTLVFFDDLKHVGIVNDSNSFFHAQTSVGTNLSRFDPYRRPKVTGYRRVVGAP